MDLDDEKAVWNNIGAFFDRMNRSLERLADAMEIIAAREHARRESAISVED